MNTLSGKKSREKIRNAKRSARQQARRQLREGELIKLSIELGKQDLAQGVFDRNEVLEFVCNSERFHKDINAA